MSQKLILSTLMWVCSSFSLSTYIQRSLGPQKVLLRRKSPPQTGFQLPTYLSVFPPSEVRRNLDQYKVSSRAIFIPSHSQTLQKSALHKEYSTKGEESEDCPGPGARIREDQSGKMSPGEGGSEGSGSIQDAYWWRRCEVPESRGRRRDCYMCVTFSDQVLNEGLFSGFSGCRYLDRSTTVYPSSEPVLWHNWAWSDWYISNATEISWRPLQAPYTDPTTGLRYHDKSVYEYIKSLVCFFCWNYSKSCAHMRCTEYKYSQRIPIWYAHTRLCKCKNIPLTDLFNSSRCQFYCQIVRDFEFLR